MDTLQGTGHHQGVMVAEVVAGLAPQPKGRYLDATFGGGGHTRAILAATAPDGEVLSLDRDPTAVTMGKMMSVDYPFRLTLIRSAFGELEYALDEVGWRKIHGVVFDLGVSSGQLDLAERGFSFRLDGPLDMRMDQGRETPITAAKLVNTLDYSQLTHMFWRLGEEPRARRAAQAILTAREAGPITTTGQLARILEQNLPRPRPGLHPATRVFQALRMTVNQELEQLSLGIEAAMNRLAPGGRLVILSFHSLEDRLVKQAFRAASSHPQDPEPMRLTPNANLPPPPFRLITPKPLTPGEEELRANPRSRSAKLRILEKLPLNPEHTP